MQDTSAFFFFLRERAAAYATQKQLSVLSETLKSTLDKASLVVLQQQDERKVAQQHLLESLSNVEEHVSDVWNQLGKVSVYVKIALVFYHL